MMLGWVAHVVFWIVLLVGSTGIGWRRVAVFASLWGIGYVGSRWFTSGDFLFTSYVAVLDVVLVVLVFKGDVRLM